MGNGEQRMENGEKKTKNGEWRTGNGERGEQKWKMWNAEWTREKREIEEWRNGGVENGERRMKNGEWGLDNGQWRMNGTVHVFFFISQRGQIPDHLSLMIVPFYNHCKSLEVITTTL